MKVTELSEMIKGKMMTSGYDSGREIRGGYCCDLLSHVMAGAPQDCAWMTVLTHTNIIAVAELAGIGCIVIPEGIQVPPATLEKAEQEKIPVLSSELSSYEISWRIHDALKEGV